MARQKVPRVLQMLDDISNVVNSIDDVDAVCNALVDLVTDIVNVGQCSIMLVDRDTGEMRIRVSRGLDPEVARQYRGRVGEGIAGHVAASGEPLLVPDIEQDARFRDARAADGQRYTTRSLLSVPLVLGGRTIGVVNVNNKQDGSPFDAYDEAVMRVVARFVTIALEKAQMREIVLQKQRMDAELNAARRIQELILPGRLAVGRGVDVVAVNLPARAVAGDFYDVISTPDGDLWLVIGDVCGKGLPAALYMAQVVGYFRAVCPYRRSPAELVGGVNEQLVREGGDLTFVTAQVIRIDAARRTATLCTAGHHAPLYFSRADGRAFLWESEGGPPLGVVPGLSYAEETRALRPGDRLLLYTDGVTEATNERNELFGVERLCDLFPQMSDADCAETVNRIIAQVHAHAGTDEVQDDLTLVAIQKGPNA